MGPRSLFSPGSFYLKGQRSPKPTPDSPESHDTTSSSAMLSRGSRSWQGLRIRGFLSQKPVDPDLVLVGTPTGQFLSLTSSISELGIPHMRIRRDRQGSWGTLPLPQMRLGTWELPLL